MQITSTPKLYNQLPVKHQKGEKRSRPTGRGCTETETDTICQYVGIPRYVYVLNIDDIRVMN